MKKNILYIVGLLCSLAACKKEPSTKDLLTSTEWRYQSAQKVTTSGNEAYPIDSCLMDNIFRYQADGTFKCFDGSSFCGVDDGSYLGTWTLLQDETVLGMDISGIGYYEDGLESISETELVLRADMSAFYVLYTYVPVQ